MLAIITFILGVAEVDPNLLIAALAGASGPTWVAIGSTRGTKSAVAALSARMDEGFAHQGRRIDDVYAVVAGIPKGVNTRVTTSPSGEVAVTTAPHDDLHALVRDAKQAKGL